MPDRPAAPPRVDAPGRLGGKGVVSTRMQERLSERQRSEALRRSRRAGVWWMSFFAVLAGLWLALLSPVFAIDGDQVEIEVQGRKAGDGGAGIIHVGAVADAVAVFAGENLVLMDVGDVEAAVLAVEGVRSVAVRKVWPRGLYVVAYERLAVAAVPDFEGGFVLVDADGVALRQQPHAPVNLPVVVVPVGVDHAATLGSVLGVVNELPIELSTQVEGIRADTVDSVEFDLREGPTVTWGSADQTALKAEVLLTLLASGTVDGAVRIDVSAPGLPIVVDE